MISLHGVHIRAKWHKLQHAAVWDTKGCEGMCAVSSHVWVLCSHVVCAAIVHAAATTALVLPILEGVASDNLQVAESVWQALRLVHCAGSQPSSAKLLTDKRLLGE